MLVITRRIGQAFLVGENVRIVLMDVKGVQARIAIEAPRNVPVVREELIGRHGAGSMRTNDT